MELYRYNRETPNEWVGYETYLKRYEVVKETPKGYWIMVHGMRKFVLKGSNGKRFAYETVEAALNAFKIRTTRCIGILTGQLKAAQGYLNHVNSIDIEKEVPKINKLV